VLESQELATVRAERDHYRDRLRETEAEQNDLRADLADALGQVEHWRTLAEYRERRLAERRDGTDKLRELSPGEDRRRIWPERRRKIDQ
jgi:hypothetical protein